MLRVPAARSFAAQSIRAGNDLRIQTKMHTGGILKRVSPLGRLLLLLPLVGCAASQATLEIQEGRRALLTAIPEIAVQHFERAAALDSKNPGSPLGESAWTYMGRAYYEAMKYSPARQALDRALAQNQDDVARVYIGLIDARERSNEADHKQLQAGLQGVYDRIEYIKRFTFAGEFWDPSNRLTTEVLELIQALSAAQVNWNDVIPRVEEVMLKIENEIDQAQRDEVTRYRGGSDGGDM